MFATTEVRYEYRGEGIGLAEYEHDLIRDLGRRLGCLWEYDRCIASACGRPELQDFWRDVKFQEQRNIERLKELIQRHSQGGDEH
jgi:DNA-binding GntR family transcriptional regulator